MGRKFRKIEDVQMPNDEPVRKMRYVVRDYDTRKREERERFVREKRRQRKR